MYVVCSTPLLFIIHFFFHNLLLFVLFILFIICIIVAKTGHFDQSEIFTVNGRVCIEKIYKR